ncbi:3'-phosphoadenosine 5'-phosphosulfate (PAPS) 3'-phosphatase [Nocardia bhagyanarayanae]|uniref:3'-phosphoadenosine 5'-phosphosulfate (PAPS) 3'-phosphatase n=1 Tax=Nocardia bhagyanarayanae TaxID=1215925 RepID=A0A543FIH6_9NOCA|nr:3'-phosphoadenosine 5'-phosphosulfate (PAPS) 3'-phosphatase [Nocardia bhagyanarayanae]
MITDARLAADLADRAGSLLSALREENLPDLGKRGDALSNDFLLTELAAARPGDAVLSEESADDPRRLAADRVWIIDPLDGTREYAIPGRSDWAVHVALWERDRGITAAAVAQPALGMVHVSDQSSANAPARDEPRLLVSDSRPPSWAREVADAVGATLVPMGSAGAKAMAVVRGEADAYLHAGGQYEWDSAAPVGVALAAGLHASRVDGRPLEYNRPRPYLPDLLICRAAWRTPLLDAVAAAAAGSG